MKKKMTVNQAEEILRQVAVQNNTTLDNVKREIKLAMMMGMQNDSPEIRKRWSEISNETNTLTPEEMLIYMTSQL